jgi:hypothetical protein
MTIRTGLVSGGFIFNELAILIKMVTDIAILEFGLLIVDVVLEKGGRTYGLVKNRVIDNDHLLLGKSVPGHR